MESRRMAIIFLCLVSLFCIFFSWPEYRACLGIASNVPTCFMIDFSGYYLSAGMLLSGNSAIYSEDAVNRFALERGFVKGMNYGGLNNYPPCFYMMMTFLARLPYFSAINAWLVLNHLFILMTAAFVFMACRGAQAERAGGGVILVPLFFVAGLFFFPSIDEFAHGQTGIVVAMLTALCLYLYSRGSLAAAGAALGAAGAIKGMPLFFLLYFVWKKRWKPVAAALITFGVLMIIPCLIWGWGIMGDFLSIRSRVMIDWGKWPVDQSLNALLQTYLPWAPMNLIRVAKILLSLVFVGLTLYSIRGEGGRQREVLGFSLMVILLSVVTHYAHPHNHVILLMPLMAFFACYILRKNWGMMEIRLFYGLVMAYGLISCTMSGFVGVRWLAAKKLLLGAKVPYLSILLLWGLAALLVWQMKEKQPGRVEDGDDSAGSVQAKVIAGPA